MQRQWWRRWQLLLLLLRWSLLLRRRLRPSWLLRCCYCSLSSLYSSSLSFSSYSSSLNLPSL
jgi:hypothetical protein